MIRDPKASDIDRITELTEEIYGRFMSLHNTPVNLRDLRTTVEAFVEHKNCLLVERNGTVVGIMAWQLTPHPANYSCIIFQEILWCVKSPYFMDASILLKAIERKARELKANVIMIANLSVENGPRLRRIYEKLGYQFMETQFSKSIGG